MTREEKLKRIYHIARRGVEKSKEWTHRFVKRHPRYVDLIINMDEDLKDKWSNELRNK
jgi:hypothetical protein